MKYLFCSLLFIFCFEVKGQDILTKISNDACDCITKLPYDSTAIIPNDSINTCIVKGVMNNFEEATKNKRLKLGTVEGIISLRNKVEAILTKNCSRVKVKNETKK